MRTSGVSNSIFRRGLTAVVCLTTFSLRANPIELPERPVTPEIIFLLTCAILLEVICVWLLLRHSRRPRFFVLWLIGMNLITYPAFVGLLRLLDYMRPALAVLTGEALVVVVEGAVIYLICRFVRPAKSELPAPSAVRCWMASLIGNACSAAAFPLLLWIYDRFAPI